MENLLTDNCMKLGFGMMRLPRTEGTKEIDLEQTKQMVDEFTPHSSMRVRRLPPKQYSATVIRARAIIWPTS